MRQVCFRLPDTDPLSVAHVDEASRDPLDLGSSQGEALAELLQVLACGEESAALAFQRLSDTRAEVATQRALAVIASEEAVHEELLRSLRAGLPDPAADQGLRKALVRFYHGLGHPNPGHHLAAIAALDSAVCIVVGALLHQRGPLRRERSAAAILARIRRDETGHVRLSRSLARDLAGASALDAVAEQTRSRLIDLLRLRADAFEVLGVDPDRLFMRLRVVPPSLFA